MKKIGIIRGLLPRLSQAEFAASFSTIKPVFITGEANTELSAYCKKQKLLHRNLPVTQLYPIEPVQFLFGKRSHQSWVGVSGLVDACRDVDVLETYELYHFFSGQAAAVAKQLQIPLVCEVWTSFATHPAYLIPPYRQTVQNVITQTTLFVARSERAADSLRQLGIPKEKIQTIYHGVNSTRFIPATNKKKQNRRVLFVGELTDYKGVSLLLAVWPHIIEKYPDAELVLAGNGPLAAHAKALPGVTVLGYVPYAKLPAVYASCDLFVSPSQDRFLGPLLWWEEFFSYTLMEALAAGLPIVATRSGGIPEEIGEENWLILQRNQQALLDSILDALAHPAKGTLLSKKNRQRAEKYFDLDKQTLLLERTIEKMVL